MLIVLLTMFDVLLPHYKSFNVQCTWTTCNIHLLYAPQPSFARLNCLIVSIVRKYELFTLVLVSSPTPLFFKFSPDLEFRQGLIFAGYGLVVA